ncbi:MAG: DUF4126 family protein [Aliifodinibius sp.]|nr:DUF4126 domain-containing protein [Fodinibius sp.]NIV09782.1 DUF4126 family protein [Fodinibius sp.]NIY23308.1 DUF4126 family protein [Fodinibius sp.]
MIEAFSNVATSFGLSTAAGLNAYLPLLVVALVARYSNLITLNEPWDVMTNGWVIAALGILLFIEMTVDKIPAVDTMNDTIQTVGRPLSGAILFAANSGVIGELHPAMAFVAGLILAGGVHAVKTVSRPAITAVTVGTGNWFVSLVEDIVALVTTILSLVLPIIMASLIVIGMVSLGLHWRKQRARPKQT